MVKLNVALTLADLAAQDRAIADRKAGIAPVRVAPNVYDVPSSSRPGVHHTVQIHHVGLLQASCSCEHGQRADAKGRCRHSASALMAELERVNRPAPRRALNLVQGFVR